MARIEPSVDDPDGVQIGHRLGNRGENGGCGWDSQTNRLEGVGAGPGQLETVARRGEEVDDAGMSSTRQPIDLPRQSQPAFVGGCGLDHNRAIDPGEHLHRDAISHTETI